MQLWAKRRLIWALHSDDIPASLAWLSTTRAIRACFKAWEQPGGFEFFQSWEQPRQNIDIILRFSAQLEAPFTDGAHARGGFPWTSEIGNIYINPAIGWTVNFWDFRRLYLPSTLLHEIGHVLGLDHAPEGVMHPLYSRTRKVTAKDQAKLHALYAPQLPPSTHV